jgi:predicted ATP-dependent endonuclease of OLD family
MAKVLHLKKAIIRNFRSIEEVYIENIGDIAIFIGANESGKSNILKALNWFGNDEPLKKDDIPIEFLAKIYKEYEMNPIVESYFEIVDIYTFKEKVIFSILEILEEVNIDDKYNIGNILHKYNIGNILHKLQFLKYGKYYNGAFTIDIYDDELNNQTNNIRNMLLTCFIKYVNNPLNLFDILYKLVLKKVAKELNVSESQIFGEISNTRYRSSFNSYHQKFINEINRSNTFEKYENICNRIKNILQTIPNSYMSISISGESVRLNPYRIFNEVVMRFTAPHINAFMDIKPNLIYLDEDMELKNTVMKSNKWSATLNEDNKNYIVNSRLFRAMGISLEEFEKESMDIQRAILDNNLLKFSENVRKHWDKNISIKAHLSEKEMSFNIEEYNERHEPIPGKTTPPDYRSKGFRWFLAYLITLEYLKVLRDERDADMILLLDDPAVYLHPTVQKLFLEKLEKLSKKYQILYNTHLMSLFNENELDRVFLVKHDEKNNKTKVNKPWSNDQKDIIQPIRHALGFDKRLFEENLKKVLFVEGITDKFVLEGLRKVGKLPKFNDWYIHPLNGGNKNIDKNDNNEIVKKIKLYGCLSNIDGIKYYFLLDGDMRKEFKSESSKDATPEKTLFIGDKDQELEDLIDKEFYLNCVLETYKTIFIHEPEKFKKVEKIVKGLKSYNNSLITKKLSENFKQEKSLGSFSKSDVAITIKRKLYKDSSNSKYFKKVIECLKNGKLTCKNYKIKFNI